MFSPGDGSFTPMATGAFGCSMGAVRRPRRPSGAPWPRNLPTFAFFSNLNHVAPPNWRLICSMRGSCFSDLHAAGEEIHLPVIAVSVNRPGAVDAELSRRAMHEAFADPASHPFGEKVAGYVILHGGEGEAHELAKAIAMELPPEARLEMGRLSGVRELQRETAQVVIKSMSAICGAIGAQPIPLADFPILTSLQAAMVAGIMHISGRELSMKLAGEWMAAIGANIGMALALREGARAALKFVPIWGDVVSGGIAAAGTYAIGRAASAYFIEGMTLQDARQLFRKSKKPAPLLKE